MRTSRREQVGVLFGRLVEAVRHGDDDTVEAAVLALSRRSRWLAPLALLVGGFAMLFQGVKTLFTNWRLTLIQILPAMWIWVAMVDLKAHVLHGREFHVVKGPLVVTPIVLGVAAITAASFYLNAVFAFSISTKGTPEIRPAFAKANEHLRTILAWGIGAGVLLGVSAFVVDRWGELWFAVCMGIMTGFLMFAYVALPSRLLGLKANQSRRDKLTASAVGGAVGAIICSPPYVLGRVALIMIGSHEFRYLAVLLLIIAVILQTGATSAVKAVKMSAKIVAGISPEEADAEVFGEPAGPATAPAAEPVVRPAAGE
ncbi:MAG: hypothetical protein ABSF84_09475 [Acidimicrobiales bacterium]